MRYLRALGRASTARNGNQPGTPPAEAGDARTPGRDESAAQPPRKAGRISDTQTRSSAVLGRYGPERALTAAASPADGSFPAKRTSAFLQYWLFYPDNPCVLPPGRHDGDWELVQVRVRDSRQGSEAAGATLGRARQARHPELNIQAWRARRLCRRRLPRLLLRPGLPPDDAALGRLHAESPGAAPSVILIPPPPGKMTGRTGTGAGG